MRILVDATTAREGGGITYICSILPALLQRNRNHEYYVLLSRRYQGDLIAVVPPGMQVITPDLPAVPPIHRLWYLQTTVPRLLREEDFDLLFSVAEVSSWRAPCPTVVAVRNPNLYAPLHSFSKIRDRLFLAFYRMFWTPFVYSTLHRSNRLIFVSEAFQKEVVSRLHIDGSKTCVIYHGLDPAFSANGAGSKRATFFNDYPYLLAVSTIAPHKNYEGLLQAFAAFANWPSLEDLHLVIAGSTRNSRLYGTLLSLAESLGVSHRIHFLGRIPHNELPALYRGAQAFILPSRLETFGHPLVEAMACGTPVIASDLPVCREICQGVARYFSPDDVKSMADHISTVIREPAVRQDMIRRGLQRAQDFSWDRTAEQLVQVFEEVAGL